MAYGHAVRIALPPTTRRGLSGLALGVAVAVTAGGCDLDDLRAPETGPEPDASGAPQPETDPDEVIVERVVAALGGAHALATAAAADARLAALAAPFAALHDAHLTALDAAAPQPAPAPPAPAGVAALRTAEKSLQKELATAALEVASGPLARHLASMSAAVAQLVSQLPAGKGAR